MFKSSNDFPDFIDLKNEIYDVHDSLQIFQNENEYTQYCEKVLILLQYENLRIAAKLTNDVFELYSK